jgi:hypothetical protein
MAKTHGLKSPQPIMRSTRQSGDCYYMFQSGSKVLSLEPDCGRNLGDCDIDEAGGYYSRDRQAEIRIAGDCEGT